MIDSKTVIYPTKNNHAFTIIELLIVIVVIGILVAISVVSYLGIQSRARDAVNETNISGIFKSVELHKAQKNIYPDFLYSETWEHLVWTSTNGTPASMYRNPAAPDWLPSSFVLNAYYYDYSTREYAPMNDWNDSAIQVLKVLPKGFNSWSQYYNSAYVDYSTYISKNPYNRNIDTDKWETYVNEFNVSYSQYKCFPYFNDCATEEKIVKKEWLYFVDPLMKSTDDHICIGQPSDDPEGWSGLTGLRIRYFSQATNTWKEIRSGNGEVARFLYCTY